MHRDFLFSIRRQTYRNGNPMQSAKLLHDLFDNACQSIDKRITRTLFQAADTLIQCKKLSIVSLGRSLKREAGVKHNIKCIDRLFGNKRLHDKGVTFYQAMSELLLKDNIRPVIIIDWSGLTRCGTYHFLRASLAAKGRAITLYERAYPLQEAFQLKTHSQFLLTLRSLLPKDCKPIVITDAGFRNSWFKCITELEWDYVGRIRSATKYCLRSEKEWYPIKSLYGKAKSKASYIGQVLLAQHNPFPCYFYLMKQNKKYRVKRNLLGKKVQCSSSIKHEERENEPWLIATSLSEKEFSAKEVMNFYKKRMQIEESFRDLKNMRNGFGLRHCRSFNASRLNVALLIASLAMLVLWILGLAAKLQNLHYSFQTNTEKRRNVLSNFVIGWQIVERRMKMRMSDVVAAIKMTAALTLGELKC